MERLVRLDFETRSELDVRDVSAQKYSKHISTDVICVAYSIDGGPVKLWHPFTGARTIPKDLHNALFVRGYQLEAHNKMFEESIWANVMVKKYGWPEIKDPEKTFLCTAAMAAIMGLPRSLDQLGKALRLSKQKDLDGKRVMLKLTKPRRPTKSDPVSRWHESPEDLNRVFSYCKDDVLSETEASRNLLPLSDFEREVWLLDQRINRRGVNIDLEAVESALYLLEWHRKDLCAELVSITGGLVSTPAEVKNMLDFCESCGVHLPNLQRQTVEEYLAGLGDTMPGHVRRVLEIRLQLSKSSTTKYQAMLDRVDDDGRVKDILIYAGASTGRWAGSGIQIQNLPAGRGFENKNLLIDIIKIRNLELLKTCYNDPFTAISAAVRGMICAPRGKVLRSIDYNAIEARTVFWLAGCDLGIKEFEENKPIYRLMAAEIFNIPEPEVTEDHRDLGKRVILGAGYGMGADKFVITCKMQGNKVIEKDLALRAINAYRTRYKEVPMLWRALDQAAMSCVASPIGTKITVGKVTFELHEKYLTIRLPSARRLFYWYPRIKETETKFGVRPAVFFSYVDSQTRQWVEGSSYGGLWTENITQAVARDIMAAAMLAVDNAGHNVIFSVHDEIVLEDDNDFKTLKDVEDCMLKSRPQWAAGLPLVVKGWEGERYKK